jgi:hypothetical protein
MTWVYKNTLDFDFEESYIHMCKNIIMLPSPDFDDVSDMPRQRKRKRHCNTYFITATGGLQAESRWASASPGLDRVLSI